MGKRGKYGNSYAILIGLVVGIVLGLIANHYQDQYPEFLHFIRQSIAKPIGDLFLNSLFMLVLPVMTASIALGVARIGEISQLRRLGFRVLTFMVITTGTAISGGLFWANLIKPGDGFSTETREELLAEYGELRDQKIQREVLQPWTLEFYVKIIPRNILKTFVDYDMLSIILVSILLGVLLLHLGEERTKYFRSVLENIFDGSVWFISIIMKLAPFAVACLIFVTVALLGPRVITQLGFFVLTVCLGLLTQYVVIYPILLKFLSGYPVLQFYKNMIPVLTTAISTSSSNATLPVSLQVAEEDFKVPKHIAGFTLPLGATINMDGTALFEAVAALFIAQVFGIDLSLGMQITLVLLVVLSSIGVAGIPGGSIPLLMIVLSQIDVPVVGIALILGPDRILDMLRTSVNVTGDMVTCLFVSKHERRLRSASK